MGPTQIFISYRRDDAAGYARAVNDELTRCFGAERVFIDVDDINAGQPFSEVIQRSVGDSAVLLALIGRRWLGEREGAPPRVFEAGDFVRQEVAAGLAKGLRVIPVLLDGAAMPDPAQLPPELRPLAGRNALALDNTRFAADMAHLVREVRGALGEEALPPPARGGFTKWWLAGAVLALAAIAALWQLRSSPDERAMAPAARPAARPQVNGEWRAEVDYDWPNAHYVERFVFSGEGDELNGSASFLGVARGVLESRIDAEGVSFVTRTSELAGAGGSDPAVVHRYRGRLSGAEIRFVMQTEGGSSAHVPVEFVARRVASAAPQASR
ncbi:MAG TPA: toll/interleukin-1 receptor domain-containing protein [Caldimonas sp.]